MGRARDANLVVKAMRQALTAPGAHEVELFHSDQGVEYAAHEYRKVLKTAQITRSISRVGNCYDNAHMESFFHTLKTECAELTMLKTAKQIMTEISRYIDYYNHRRRHSSLGYLSPVDFEAKLGLAECVH